MGKERHFIRETHISETQCGNIASRKTARGGQQVVRKVLKSLQALAGRTDARKESAPFAGTYRKWIVALFPGFSLQNALCPLFLHLLELLCSRKVTNPSRSQTGVWGESKTVIYGSAYEC